jgi:hypothetical protein
MYKSLLFSSLLISSLQFAACKGGKNTNTAADSSTTIADTVTTTATPAPAPTAVPVEVAQDDALITNVKDATKDFPGVTATVSEGEITLTGNITRSKLPELMQSLNSLHPKKINNNLTIN